MWADTIISVSSTACIPFWHLWSSLESRSYSFSYFLMTCLEHLQPSFWVYHSCPSSLCHSPMWRVMPSTDPRCGLTRQRTGTPALPHSAHSFSGSPTATPHWLCSYPYHSTYTCLQLSFQLFVGTKHSRDFMHLGETWRAGLSGGLSTVFTKHS